MAKTIAREQGSGSLRLQGANVRVDYSLETPERGTGRGSIFGSPDLMRSAFRAGEAVLTLADGERLRLRVVANTEGGNISYVEFAGDERQRPAGLA